VKAKKPPQNNAAQRKPPKGRPFVKGQSGNPGGVPKQTLELRAALTGSATEIHAALMALVREGNVQAILYAHQQIIGKPSMGPEDQKTVEGLVIEVRKMGPAT
jgi:hypothetical protein